MSLGGLIKDLRIQKNISQLDVSFAMGWKEPSRLSRIEHGKHTNPPLPLIKNIMEAMKLSGEEKNEVLLAGNFLPTETEISQIQTKMHPLLKELPFPVYLMDYSWRVIYMNNKMYELFDIPVKKQEQIEGEFPNILELLFKLSSYNEERKQFLLQTLALFQYEQRDRSRQKWHQELVKKMMRNELFRELWPLAQKQVNKGLNFDDVFRKYKIKVNRKNLEFLVVNSKLKDDPRYILESYIPANKTSLQYL